VLQRLLRCYQEYLDNVSYTSSHISPLARLSIRASFSTLLRLRFPEEERLRPGGKARVTQLQELASLKTTEKP
jgi:hypothetical protein